MSAEYRNVRVRAATYTEFKEYLGIMTVAKGIELAIRDAIDQDAYPRWDATARPKMQKSTRHHDLDKDMKREAQRAEKMLPDPLDPSRPPSTVRIEPPLPTTDVRIEPDCDISDII